MRGAGVLNETLENSVTPGFPREIGGVMVNNPVWLAPMAGITFGSVRQFYRKLGAGLVHTEMVSALGLCHNGRKTRELLYGSDMERPCVLQLFGSDAGDIARGAETALSIRSFEALEVNMACPMPKVTKKGSGAKVMEAPAEAAKMMRELKKTGLPVWSKIRVAPKGSALSAAQLCETLFEAGADFIFVHGRTAAQRYEGVASRDAVGEIAAKFPGRIGGSGDCYSPEDFTDYISRGCAAVLAGRGFLRDALLIPRSLSALGADIPDTFLHPSPDYQAQILLELGRNIYNNEGESLAMSMARRMLASLFKGFPGAARLRRRGALARAWRDMEYILLNWADVLEEPETAYEKEKYPRGVIGDNF